MLLVLGGEVSSQCRVGCPADRAAPRFELGHVLGVAWIGEGAGELDQERLEAHPQLQGCLADSAGVEVGPRPQ